MPVVPALKNLCAGLLLGTVWLPGCGGNKVDRPDGVPSGRRAVVLLAGSSGTRVGTAAALFLDGEWDLLILTNDGVLGGWSRPHQRNLYHVEKSEETLVRYGVPRRAIVKLPFIRSGTIYDALATRRYHREHPLAAMTLVTSDYHADRARWTFERVFARERVLIEVCPVSARERRARETLTEAAKTFWYFLRYGLFSNP